VKWHFFSRISAQSQVEVRAEDVARLSLGHTHINVLGRYHFNLPEALKNGEMRPLRNPDDFSKLDQ
jgi:hypothetical protein